MLCTTLKYAKRELVFQFRYSRLSLPQQPLITQLFITFELDLQDFVQILQDVPIGLKSVARTVYADFQAKVGLCKEDNSVRKQSSTTVTAPRAGKFH